MKFSNFVLILVGSSGIVSSEKYCTMSASRISCTYDPKGESSLSIQMTDIKALDLSGTEIHEVRSYVEDYVNLEDLNLSSCRIKSLGKGTFAQLSKLIKLNLSDNLITSFDGNSFDKPNVLNILILSDNLLNSLSELHLDAFPKLNVLDVSGNQLKYLTGDVIEKIRRNPTFSLYAANNPWNCSISHWMNFLETNEDLKNKFCHSNSNSFLGKIKYKEGKRRGDLGNSIIRESCGFFKCKWWIIGSLWIGVILGNVNKLNKLLYQSRCRKKKAFEKSVGTEAEIHHSLRDRVVPTVEEMIAKSRT
ncbi:uncharacterized protein LOC123674065 [Harmonia axyridis]|uniref:uncharacterized protein LOC123674065 n=1 Tax=Harmonia axyridis TaxID=115357 RepID=UPI001E27530C|nr:uncharacterized protein LOC123674065 [Harmonia axyridis]